MSHDSAMRSAAYTAEDLRSMKVSEIKSLAADLGYGIKAVKKDDMIAEILRQQYQ